MQQWLIHRLLKMNSKLSNLRFILLAVSLGLLCLVAGANIWRIYEAKKWNAYESLILMPEPRVIADFELTRQNGERFSLDNFKGHWSLLFFGYTSCPDVCPSTLQQLQQARRLMLQKTSADKLPGIYFVSVDPERDTPQKLAEYLSYFDPSFIGLSGEPQQLQALALQLGIVFFLEPHEQGNFQYNVDHSASLLLLDPQGQLYAVLPAPQQASTIAHDILTVISRESSAP